MNLTFLDNAHIWDAIFLVIMLICIAISAKRGAAKAVSGVAGTVLGFMIGSVFQGGLAPFVERAIHPMMLSLAGKLDLSSVTGVREGSVISQITEESSMLSDKLSDAYQSLLVRLADTLSSRFAPILAFLALFLLTKLAVFLTVLVLDWDVPVLSDLNRFVGGLLGAASGLLIILALCWAIMRFAPADNVGLLDQLRLQQSYVGGLIVSLFSS